MDSQKITDRIKDAAFKLLDEHPAGLRYSELHAKISEIDKSFNSNTINGCIWDLDIKFPDKIYKPSRGLFRLTQYRSLEAEPQSEVVTSINENLAEEEDFYSPFADWLKNEIEDVTKVISLGGNTFRDKWGTPDVIGIRESSRSDIIKGPTEIVSAEIKTETSQLVTAFGQVCAYKIFSHKAYLVIPRQSAEDEISRLDSLCQIFGIGLVTFNSSAPTLPDQST